MKSEKVKPINNNKSSFWIVLGLFIIVLLCFYKIIYFDFVWDDRSLYISAEKLIRNFNLLSLFVPRKDQMYIPVTFIFWKIVGELGGIKDGEFIAFPYHLLNLIIHTINTIIVFYIVRKIHKNDILSLLGAIIFAIHPIQVESVAWVSEARGLLSAAFGLLAFLIYLESTEKNQRNINPWVIFLLILSMMSKPSGIVFSIIIVVYNFFLFKSENLKTILVENWFYLVLILPFIYLAKYGESTRMIEFEPAIWFRGILFINSLGFYFYKIFIPLNFSPGYGYTAKFLLANPQFLLYMVIGLLFIIALIVIKDKIFRVSILIFILGFLPVSNLFAYYYQYWSTVADRYVYVSMTGVAIFIPYFITKIVKMKKLPYIIFSLGLVFSVLTANELKKWIDDFTLWSSCIENYPGRSPHPYLGRGLIYQEKGLINEAINDFTKCIEIDSTYFFAYYNRGNIFFDQKQYDLAIKDYSRAISINPKYINAIVNRGISYMELSQYADANLDFTNALRFDSNQLDAIYYRAFSYLKQYKYDSALIDFERYFYLNPNDNEVSEIIKGLKSKNRTKK